MLDSDKVTSTAEHADEGMKITLHLPDDPTGGVFMDNMRLSETLVEERQKAGYKSQASLLRAIKEKTGMTIDKRVWSNIEKGQMPKYDQIIAFCMTVAGENAMQLLADITYHMLPAQWREKQQGFVDRMQRQETVESFREAAAKMQALFESVEIADQEAKPRQ